MIKKPKISPQERDQIALLLSSGSSIRNVARILGRSVSTVSVEIKRNSVDDKYQSIAADTLSRERNAKSRRLNPLKNSFIFSYVCDKLRCGWSPEQISGRLKKDNRGKNIICHETIYRYIYSEQGKTKKLQVLLTMVKKTTIIKNYKIGWALKPIFVIPIVLGKKEQMKIQMES